MTKMPAHIAKMLEGQNVTETDAMDVGSGGVPRISLKNRKFTAKVGEEETKLGEKVKVVILGISPEHGFAKTFYESGYSPTSADAPTCQSSDGIRPDAFVETPVNDICRTCEKSQWGSAKSMSGGKAKACKDSKRLHVILAADVMKKEPVIYILTVTVLSLKPFGSYGKSLAKQGIPTPAVVITELAFDEEASVPKLEFEMIEYLTEKQCEPAIAIATDRPWDAWKNATSNRIAAPVAEPPKEEKAVAVVADGEKSDGDPLDEWND